MVPRFPLPKGEDRRGISRHAAELTLLRPPREYSVVDLASWLVDSVRSLSCLENKFGRNEIWHRRFSVCVRQISLLTFERSRSKFKLNSSFFHPDPIRFELYSHALVFLRLLELRSLSADYIGRVSDHN